VIKKSYQYYDDATLKFTQDQLTINSKFDRKYEYDHVGRVIKGLSGQEARGGGTTSDRPYNETHTYDEFNHLRLRFVRQWSRLPSGSGGEFANNRMSDWQYDSDGRPVSGATGTYSYDAAGTVESFGDSAPYKTDQQFDGDGVRLKSTLNNFDSETSQWSVEKVTYYIHSTVLGGAIVSELTAQGAKEHTYVHWNGAVLAVQNVAGSTQWVQWKHFDASSATYRATNSSGQVGESAEMDIVGANAGLFNTNPWPVPKSSGELQPYFSTSDLNSKAECSLASPKKKDDGAGGRGVDEGSGGIPMPCALLDSMARGDAIGSMRSYGFSMGSHAVWVSKDTSYGTSDLDRQVVTVYSGPGGEFVWVDDPGTVIETWVQTKKKPIDPREVTRRLLSNDELALLKQHFDRIVAQEECSKFLEEFLKKAEEDNPTYKRVPGNVKSFYESVNSGGGFWSAFGSSYNTIGGDIRKNTGAVYFSNDPRFYSVGPVNEKAKEAFLSVTFHGMAQTVIHELLHHAGFGDRALANAAARWRGETVSFANGWEGSLAASNYWDKLLQEHCH
jgi:hypothetical protein